MYLVGVLYVCYVLCLKLLVWLSDVGLWWVGLYVIVVLVLGLFGVVNW